MGREAVPFFTRRVFISPTASDLGEFEEHLQFEEHLDEVYIVEQP